MKLLAISTASFTASNREIYRRLENKRVNVKLLIPKYWNFGTGIKQSERRQANDPEIIFLESTNYHQRLYRLKGIKKILNQYQPDVIYFEGDPGSTMAAVLGVYAKKNKLKLFALSCENLSQSPLAVLKREGLKQLFSALIKYSLILFAVKKIDTLFVINKEGLNYFKKLGFKNVIQTPLGFNEEIFKIDQRRREVIRGKLAIDKDTVVIAYFGRVVFEKGIHLLINALENLKFDNWVFLMDSFGRYKNDYQKDIENRIRSSELKDKTIFFEANHTEIADYMNASDITILPSIPTNKWVEQYGRVVPEALACGNLLIISNKGAQADFFDNDYHFKFNPEKPEGLLNLIQEAIINVSRNRYNQHSFSNYSIKSFGLDVQAKIILNALDKK